MFCSVSILFVRFIGSPRREKYIRRFISLFILNWFFVTHNFIKSKNSNIENSQKVRVLIKKPTLVGEWSYDFWDCFSSSSSNDFRSSLVSSYPSTCSEGDIKTLSLPI